MSEIWSEVFPGMIPKQNYIAHVTNGEEDGLIIRLNSREYEVLIDFGAVGGLQMMDEGMLLCCPSFENETNLRECNFSNTIYLVENGPFGSYTKACLGPDLFLDLGYREYVIVTLNYVISVVSQWEPDITVRQIN